MRIIVEFDHYNDLDILKEYNHKVIIEKDTILIRDNSDICQILKKINEPRKVEISYTSCGTMILKILKIF